VDHGLTGVEIAWAAQMACLYEAAVDKPGNVSPAAPFPDARFEDFAASAVALGPAFTSAGEVTVGETVAAAAAATRRLVASNTNLGIVLLLAPLARGAATAAAGESLRASVARVLAGLTVDDARLAYQAIRDASPAGLGTVADHDVAGDVAVTLLEAMAAARDRDSVAREYVTDFEITFTVGATSLVGSWESGACFRDAVVTSFLSVLARVPDTLIVRKNGPSAAEEVSLHATGVLKAGGLAEPEGRRRLAALEDELRDERHALNPGTTADLIAASLFVFLTEAGMLERLPEITARW
jgi:triphosphoribosyl-dephospho-CoA synthase